MSEPREFELRRHDGAAALRLMDRLTDAYIEGYAEDPDAGRSIYARDAFVTRTTGQAVRPGFVLVTAHSGDDWCGFSFGLPFGVGRWWAGALEGEAPRDVVAGGKFAVIELVVLPAARGVGLATELMTAVLDGRPEPWATLLADQEGKARSIYARWGWTQAGIARPAPDVPPLDVLIRPLRRST